MIRWRRVVIQYPCELCNAGPGDPCRTWTGRVSPTPHAERSRLASANGWRDPDEDEEPRGARDDRWI